MYVSSFNVLNTALSGVEAADEELSITGENISNNGTTDYEKQKVVTAPSASITESNGGHSYQIGTGVTVTSVVNSADPYLDASWRSQNAATNSASTTQSYTNQLDAAIGNTSDADTGVGLALSTFWGNWNDLAGASTNSIAAAKQAVVSAGAALASELNSLSSDIAGSGSTSVLGQADSQYSNLLSSPTGSGESGGDVYNDAYEIASLNKSITQATNSGENANTLIDQRNEYIDDLSALGNVSTTSNSDGSVTVYFGGASTALVADPESGSTSTATSTSDDAGNNFDSWLTSFQSNLTSATSTSSAATSIGGTLGALVGLAGIDTANATIATASTLSNTTTLSGSIGTVMNSLNKVASSLATEVGEVGVLSSDGTTLSAQSFFTASDGSGTVTAANIEVNPTLSTTPASLWAGAATDSTSDTGDMSVANAEAAHASGGSADSAYGSFVELIGNIASAANANESTQSALSTQVSNQRASAEGVDLDEEMTNLISEQQAYQASAKVMNAFGTMMDALMAAVSG